jgi:hypothetical protein
MVEATGPVICRCKIVGNRLVFCPLHESAEGLLAACEHLRKFLRDVRLAEEKDRNMLREVILLHLDGHIAAAVKKAVSDDCVDDWELIAYTGVV